MAAGRVSSDSTLGPCVEPCKHKDCAECRVIVAAECVYCGKPIGYDTNFYRESDTPVVNYSHALCAELAAEAQ